MELSDTQSKLAIVVIVVLVLGLGWFLWKRSGPPTPNVPPGQSLQNPFGSAAPTGPSPGAVPGR